jgi:hypothetical protein
MYCTSGGRAASLDSGSEEVDIVVVVGGGRGSAEEGER